MKRQDLTDGQLADAERGGDDDVGIHLDADVGVFLVFDDIDAELAATRGRGEPLHVGRVIRVRDAHLRRIGRQGRHRILRLGLGRERRPWFEGLWSRLQECDPWKITPLSSER